MIPVLGSPTPPPPLGRWALSNHADAAEMAAEFATVHTS